MSGWCLSTSCKKCAFLHVLTTLLLFKTITYKLFECGECGWHRLLGDMTVEFEEKCHKSPYSHSDPVSCHCHCRSYLLDDFSRAWRAVPRKADELSVSSNRHSSTLDMNPHPILQHHLPPPPSVMVRHCVPQGSDCLQSKIFVWGLSWYGDYLLPAGEITDNFTYCV